MGKADMFLIEKNGFCYKENWPKGKVRGKFSEATDGADAPMVSGYRDIEFTLGYTTRRVLRKLILTGHYNCSSVFD